MHPPVVPGDASSSIADSECPKILEQSTKRSMQHARSSRNAGQIDRQVNTASPHRQSTAPVDRMHDAGCRVPARIVSGRPIRSKSNDDRSIHIAPASNRGPNEQ
jgi:hypothetical protein